MQLFREEFLKAVKFLKPAILVSDNPSPMNYVHVKINADRCQMTTANGYCGKRVTLKIPTQISIYEEPMDENQEYLIDKPTFESFETLCSKHKSKLEKAAKSDASLRVIDISRDVLESYNDKLHYFQPPYTFPDVDKFFNIKDHLIDRTAPIAISKIIFNSSLVIDTLKEFNSNVNAVFSGEECPVYIEQKDKEFQAFFMPCKPILEDG